MNAFKTLFLTELKLSWRGLDMVIFALALPVVVLVLIGLLYGQQAAFAGAEHTFVEQFFGAVSTIAICAGGLMGLPLVIAEARHCKLFKRFWVTPASPQLLLAVYLAVYVFYAVVSLVIVYLVAHWGFQGATLPYEKLPQLVQQLADWLPLSQGIKLLKAAFWGLPLENGELAALVLIGLSIVCLTAAIKFFRWK